jgi:hypothetical protein
MWGSHGSEGREGRGYRFGAGRCWAVGSFWLWAGMVPGAQFHIFLFFASFLFLIFLFLSQILQKCSKTIQTTFRDFCKKSLQGFKSVGNKFFRIKTRFLIELWIEAKGFACIKLIGI